MSAAARSRAERYFDARTNVGVVVDELLRIAHRADDAAALDRQSVTGVSQT
jgi:hypothetical protein